MHTSRLLHLLNVNTPLPTDLNRIITNYSTYIPLPDYIASFFRTNDPKHAITIADICFKELKKQPDEMKDNGSTITYPIKADGVANALCSLDEDKTQFLFKQWEIMADDEEEEVKEADVTCSRYRFLIAYYLPSPMLLTDNYGMLKVEAYFHNSASDLTADKLIHAVKIKLAIARQSDEVVVSALLDTSTIHLNLLAANLTDYSFEDRNLDYACLKDTAVDEDFIEDLPASFIQADFKGIKVNASLRTIITDDSYKLMTQPQAGLDIVYGIGNQTLLHMSTAIEDLDYWILIKYGADPTIKNSFNQLPCHLALLYDPFKKILRIGFHPTGLFIHNPSIQSSSNYKWLLQSLPDAELLALKETTKEARNKGLIKSTLALLGIITAITSLAASISLVIFASSLSTLFYALSFIPASIISGVILYTIVDAQALGGSFKIIHSLAKTLVNGLIGYIATNRDIDRQLAINAHKENEIHALFYKITKLGETSLTSSEQSTFEHLTAAELHQALISNNQFRKNELYSALIGLLVMLFFAGITTAVVFIAPLLLTLTAGPAAWIGATAAASSLFSLAYIGLVGNLSSLTSIFIPLYEGLFVKWKMDGLINTELALRASVEQEPAASPAATPVSESKAKNTVAPVIKAAPTSPGKVSSLSLLGDKGVLQKSPSSGVRSPSPLAAFRH